MNQKFKYIEKFCPGCRMNGLYVFYEINQVPVHSVLLMPTREMALKYPKEDIALGYCTTCGFIINIQFKPELQEYSSQYEETQGFSSTFSKFHKNLALRLLKEYNLYNKTIIEIGCGKGDFLNLLCELGNNKGYGFDPAFIRERNENKVKNDVIFIQDFYSEKYSNYKSDFICCKMTLEHIQKTNNFLSIIRRSIDEKSNTILFFQVPEVTRILNEVAFWDIYYEHCSYFCTDSLTTLFQQCGFEIIDLTKDYNGQYLMVVVKPTKKKYDLQIKRDKKNIIESINYFCENIHGRLEMWRNRLNKFKQSNKKVVIWGAGSKGVAFFTTLNIQDEIEYAVDINPYKHGTYMVGTGQKIVAPKFLLEYKPDIVIAMNPMYLNEIQLELNKMNLTANLISVTN